MDTFSRFEEISVEDLTVQAELLRRFDTKYLVPLGLLPEVYAALPSTVKVLTTTTAQICIHIGITSSVGVSDSRFVRVITMNLQMAI